MIKIFKRIRLKLMEQNNSSRYLKYAFGEIILVMVGILLALQINNWNEKRKSNIFEKKLLVDLRNTIVDDYELMDLSIQGNMRSSNSNQIILDHFDQNLPYHDSLALHFETTNIWWKMLLKKTAYDKAKLYGLDFIKNDSTRILLSGLYENNLEFGNTLDDRQALYFYNTVTPIIMELFQSIDKYWFIANSGNVPYDYENLKTDKRYRTILKTNIGDRRNYNEWIQMAQNEMKKLVPRLQQEIDAK